MTDLTIEILKAIRDEVAQTNRRLDANQAQTNERLDGLGERIDHLGDRVDRLTGRVERVEASLDGVAQLMRQIVLDQNRHERFHARYVEKLDEDVTDLRARVEVLESGREPG